MSTLAKRISNQEKKFSLEPRIIECPSCLQVVVPHGTMHSTFGDSSTKKENKHNLKSQKAKEKGTGSTWSTCGQRFFLLNTSACAMSQLSRLLLLALLAPARGMLVLEKVKVLMDDIKVCASRWCRAQRGHPARAPSTAAANKASPEGAAARAASPSLDLPSAPPRRPATLP